MQTHSPWSIVQRGALNLFNERIYYLFIYLFVTSFPRLRLPPLLQNLHSEKNFKKEQKQQLHLARARHTTALYTVSLNLECKYVA